MTAGDVIYHLLAIPVFSANFDAVVTAGVPIQLGTHKGVRAIFRPAVGQTCTCRCSASFGEEHFPCISIIANLERIHFEAWTGPARLATATQILCTRCGSKKAMAL